MTNQEHPNFSRLKTICKKDLIERAKFKTYLSEEEAQWKNIKKMEEEEPQKLLEILAKCLKEQLNQYEIPLRRLVKEGKPIEKPEGAPLDQIDYVFYLKDFPQTPEELELI